MLTAAYIAQESLAEMGRAYNLNFYITGETEFIAIQSTYMDQKKIKRVLDVMEKSKLCGRA